MSNTVREDSNFSISSATEIFSHMYSVVLDYEHVGSEEPTYVSRSWRKMCYYFGINEKS